jgi:hypothetical protein
VPAAGDVPDDHHGQHVDDPGRKPQVECRTAQNFNYRAVNNEDALGPADPDVLVQDAAAIEPTVGGERISALVRNHWQVEKPPGEGK